MCNRRNLTAMPLNSLHKSFPHHPARPRSSHKVSTAVYQVTRPGHEHCDVTEGVLLDITPLEVDGKKLVTLYDKDLTEGVNLLIGESLAARPALYFPLAIYLLLMHGDAPPPVRVLLPRMRYYYVAVVSELWGTQCVRLKVTVKSDNCGEGTDCSGKGVCYSNASMVSSYMDTHAQRRSERLVLCRACGQQRNFPPH